MTSKTWIVSKHHLRIQPKAKTFAPGNLRATSDNPGYQTLVNHCKLTSD